MSDVKRILHVIPGLGHGGAEHQLMLNAAGLDRARFESHVCHLRPSTALAQAIRDSGVPVHSAVATGKLWWAKAIPKVARLIRSLQIDLVHTSNYFGDVIGGIAGRRAGVPVVSTLINIAHEPEWLIDNPRLNRVKLALVGGFQKLILRTCHSHFIAISAYVKESTVRSLGISPEKVSVIYRGVPQELPSLDAEQQGQLRTELELDGAYPVLLNVGRLVPQKGQRYLIQAMPEVLRSFPNARLLIVGAGFLEETLRALGNSLQLNGAVRFLGRREDVPQLMGISDIFVFPSLFEGLGVSLLEASAVGKPCVASHVGPLPEVIEHGKTGLLVPPQSPEHLVQAITTLAEDRELQAALGRGARERTQERFTIERAVRQLEDVYDRVLIDSPKPQMLRVEAS